MEFSEIGEKFEGLNADQVYNLAKFGKENLGITGSAPLSSCLPPLIPTLMDVN